MITHTAGNSHTANIVPPCELFVLCFRACSRHKKDPKSFENASETTWNTCRYRRNLPGALLEYRKVPCGKNNISQKETAWLKISNSVLMVETSSEHLLGGQAAASFPRYSPSKWWRVRCLFAQDLRYLSELQPDTKNAHAEPCRLDKSNLKLTVPTLI